MKIRTETRSLFPLVCGPCTLKESFNAGLIGTSILRADVNLEL